MARQSRWHALAPAWATDQWPAYLDACQRWCQQNRFQLPSTIVADANFYEEKEK